MPGTSLRTWSFPKPYLGPNSSPRLCTLLLSQPNPPANPAPSPTAPCSFSQDKASSPVSRCFPGSYFFPFAPARCPLQASTSPSYPLLPVRPSTCPFSVSLLLSFLLNSCFLFFLLSFLHHVFSHGNLSKVLFFFNFFNFPFLFCLLP